jgi:hypothetical protein
MRFDSRSLVLNRSLTISIVLVMQSREGYCRCWQYPLRYANRQPFTDFSISYLYAVRTNNRK